MVVDVEVVVEVEEASREVEEEEEAMVGTTTIQTAAKAKDRT